MAHLHTHLVSHIDDLLVLVVRLARKNLVAQILPLGCLLSNNVVKQCVACDLLAARVTGKCLLDVYFHFLTAQALRLGCVQVRILLVLRFPNGETCLLLPVKIMFDSGLLLKYRIHIECGLSSHILLVLTFLFLQATLARC